MKKNNQRQKTLTINWKRKKIKILIKRREEKNKTPSQITKIIHNNESKQRKKKVLKKELN